MVVYEYYVVAAPSNGPTDTKANCATAILHTSRELVDSFDAVKRLKVEVLVQLKNQFPHMSDCAIISFQLLRQLKVNESQSKFGVLGDVAAKEEPKNKVHWRNNNGGLKIRDILEMVGDDKKDYTLSLLRPDGIRFHQLDLKYESQCAIFTRHEDMDEMHANYFVESTYAYGHQLMYRDSNRIPMMIYQMSLNDELGLIDLHMQEGWT